MGFRCLVRDQEVDGSNPFAPTISSRTNNLQTHIYSLTAWSRARRSVIQMQSPRPRYFPLSHSLTSQLRGVLRHMKLVQLVQRTVPRVGSRSSCPRCLLRSV